MAVEGLEETMSCLHRQVREEKVAGRGTPFLKKHVKAALEETSDGLERARSETMRSRRVGCAVPWERLYLRDVTHKENALRAVGCFYKAGRQRAVL